MIRLTDSIEVADYTPVEVIARLVGDHQPLTDEQRNSRLQKLSEIRQTLKPSKSELAEKNIEEAKKAKAERERRLLMHKLLTMPVKERQGIAA